MSVRACPCLLLRSLCVERPVTFESAERLVGILHEPEGVRRDAGVVFLHGWASYRIGPHRIFVETARRRWA